MTRTVAIRAARRTAVVPRGGAFRDIEAFALAAALIPQLLADAGLDGAAVDEVILGNALSGGGNVARVAALAAGLPERVAAMTLDTQCCAGLDAIRLGAARIRAGEADCVLAGGVESFSRAPLRARRPRAGEAPAFYDAPPFTPWPEREPGMAEAAAILAAADGLTRIRQEAFAIESHRRALAAPPRPQELVAVKGIATDPFARRLGPATCARLPVLAGDAVHGITAATIAVEADAAALVLLGPAAPGDVRIVGSLARGADPMMPALAPVPAIAALLARHGLEAGDLGRIELMEAYAAQALAAIDRLGLDPARVNPEGGALARGHPIGASGAVLAVSAVHAARRQAEDRQAEDRQAEDRQAEDRPVLAAIAGAGGIASTLLLARG